MYLTYSAASALGSRERRGNVSASERRHAAQAGGGHRLAVDVVGHVAGGEHAGHRWSRSSAGRS